MLTNTKERWDASAVTDELLDDVIASLKELDRISDLHRYCLRGRVIIEHCYGGSLELWRDRRSKKTDSIRRMSERPSCPWRRTTLNNAVAVYEICQRMPVDRHKKLTASHVVEVLRLEEAEQERFLLDAEANGWSVRDLHREVVRHRRDEGETRGAPPASHIHLVESRTRRCAESMDSLLDLLEATDELPDDKARAIEECLQGIREVLTTATQRVRSVKSVPPPAPASV